MALRSVSLIILFILASPVVTLSSAQEASNQDPPAWLEEINPADYALLDSDLPGGLHVAGDIVAYADAAEMAVMKDGRTEVERVAFAFVSENICQPDPKGVADCIGGNYLLSVYVYETADQARAAWEKTVVDVYGDIPPPEGFEHVSNVIDPLDSRFGGVGGCTGPYIWYRNLACTIFGGWDENDRKIASLWLEKVSGIKPPKQVNLKMEEDISLILGYQYHGSFLGGDNYRPLLERAADQQAVQAQVFNAGDEVAEDVYIQLYLQMPGEAEHSEIGEPLLVGDVPPGEGRAVYTYWDLGGENVEGAVLGAQAYVPGAADVDPDDNFVSITVNIYYAQDGERAYSYFDDSYSFKNYNFNESETEELAEELIATVVAGVPSTLEKDLWIRLFFPTTYTGLWNYFNESYRSGAGGHCYGMAATSALYFMDPSLRPTSKKTIEMSLEEARQNIDIYHRAQMLPVIGSIFSGGRLYVARGYGQSSSESQSRTYTAVKSSLKEDRVPLIISFRGNVNGGNETWGHAVLAYKLVEVEGEDYKNVYIYDSNSDISELERLDKPMPAVTLWLDGFLYYNVISGDQDYHTRNPAWIAANPVFRTIPLEEANSLLPGLKEMAKSFIETLKKGDKFAAVTRCPADALFTDPSGRRVGTFDGRAVNEIPGAEVISSGEVEIYALPMSSEYSLEITGTGSGDVEFDVISPDGESADLVSFQEVSVKSGSKLMGELESGGEIHLLKEGSSSIAPVLEGSIDLGEIELPPSEPQSERTGSAEDEMAGTLDPVEKAIQDLRDPDVEVRREASSALFDLNDTRAVEPLIEALGDEDAEVRSNAASALGWSRDRRAVEPLTESLKDEDVVVRGVAAISLGAINDSRAVEPLIRALDDVDPTVRANAAVSLGFLKDPRALEPLIDLLSDEDGGVRSRSAFALGELGDSRAIEALIEAQGDEDETVREEASAALEKLGIDKGEKEPLTAEDDKTPESGSNAIWSAYPSWIASAERIDDPQPFLPVDPSATRIAYVQPAERGSRYVISGPEGRINESVYENVRDFVFSPDGKHYAYEAWIAEKRAAVIDGSKGAEYEEVDKVVFSRDGQHCAYRAYKDGKVIVVVDGREEGPYESISGDPIISSDGSHVAYTIAKDGINHVVFDGEVQELVGCNPVFSPDGSRWAYSRSAVYVGDPCYIALDGDVMDIGNDNRIGQMVFSADGGRFAYDLIPGGGAYGNHVVEADGYHGKEYPFPGVGTIVFSPDGSRLAYWAKAQDEGFLMVADGEEGRTYDEIGDPVFSPDGEHLAYVARDEEGKFVVLDGAEGKRYIEVWGLAFSVDGRLAYVARESRDGKEVQLVVVDGQEERPYHYDWYGQGIRSGPVYSPGGGHVVYVANDAGRAEFLVIDGVRHLHPWTFLGGNGWGEGSPIIFDSEEYFHYLAFNDTGTHLVQARIPSHQPSEAPGGSWTGIWDTTLGIMELEEVGDVVHGFIQNPYWLGRVEARTEGEALSGTIAKPPTYAPPYLDSFLMDISGDCRNITIQSKNGMEGPWTFEGAGTRN